MQVSVQNSCVSAQLTLLSDLGSPQISPQTSKVNLVNKTSTPSTPRSAAGKGGESALRRIDEDAAKDRLNSGQFAFTCC